MNSFTETGLRDDLLEAIREMGFEKPTPIQAKTIPFILSSEQDLMAFAQTGTGKTAAFGLPSIQLTNIEDRSTQTLILSPTRELCMQITKDLQNYAKKVPGLNVVAVYGGAAIEGQIKQLKKGAQIVVGTPGRTRDLINRKKLQPQQIKRLILDEADEMLSMGFQEELDAILEETPKEKLTFLFSATMPPEIIRITKKYMNNPAELAAAKQNTVAENVKHMYYMVQAKDRYEALKRIADINPNIYAIVFCRTRVETKDVARKFMEDGYNADALHGDLSQAQRDEVMDKFRSRTLQMLVATDVAARGLDVTDLTHVINYNLPDDDEVYIHRAGRTGRAGKKGTSIAITHSREGHKIRQIEKKFKISFQKEPVPGGKEICTKQMYALIDRVEKTEVDEKQIEPFLSAIYQKLEWMNREELIKRFVSAEFNRFLEYYKDARDLNVTERKGREKKGKKDRNERRGRGRDSNFARLFINIGTKNNLNPGRLIGMINEALDSSDAEIGKIELMRNFSFFEIDQNVAPELIKILNNSKFGNEKIKIELSDKKAAKDARHKSYGAKTKKKGPYKGGRKKKE